MTAELVIAGFSSLALAAGHTWIGLRWVLPHLDKGRLPGTPFGPSSLTLGMVRFCWQIISVRLPWFGVLFLALACWLGLRFGSLSVPTLGEEVGAGGVFLYTAVWIRYRIDRLQGSTS